ncbi:hypothetical protein, partial [Mesorhizobium sp.]
LNTIKEVISGQSEKLAEDRGQLSQALETDLQNVNGLISDHMNRLAADRSTLSQALEDDLAKLAESRSSIDG